MSVNWKTDHVGYDGDFIYVRFAVDQWQSLEDFEKALDGYLGIVRDQALREMARLRAPTSRPPSSSATTAGSASSSSPRCSTSSRLGRHSWVKTHTTRTQKAPMPSARAKLGLSPRLAWREIARDCVRVPSTTRTASNRHGKRLHRLPAAVPSLGRLRGNRTRAAHDIARGVCFGDLERGSA